MWTIDIAGGTATGGNNNPPGCPVTQPANRASCTAGQGPCIYVGQVCSCGQAYAPAYQWACGATLAPDVFGGTTGAGGAPSTGGAHTGGAPATGNGGTGGESA